MIYKNPEENTGTQSFGAVAPPGLEWQEGKTAATISFVNEASLYLAGKPRVSPIQMLERYVEKLKSGKEQLTEWLTVEEFMNSESIKSMG